MIQCLFLIDNLFFILNHFRKTYDGNNSCSSRLISILRFNYRSLPSIVDFYNSKFYKSKLVAVVDANQSQEARLLKQFSSIFGRSSNNGIHFVNVDGINERKKNSFRNLSEVHVVSIFFFNIRLYYSSSLMNLKLPDLQIKFLVDGFIQMGAREEDIGIITPYYMQVRIIEYILAEFTNIKFGTVEDFQGMERNIILLSTVRTCPSKIKTDVSRHLGFIKCPKRINVALSRAR